ncbi:PP2C family protein-serine/threonine phosphatase [Micromonospora purpureochromogenes]|uniref:PP2C family protein-serine/threonine phosphatase n=1 Tax=Micromonospora purpureochromogenes TaxID=47872 RepID=UPI0033F80C90
MPPRLPEKRRPHPSPGPAAGRAVGALARPESSGICSITMTLDSWTASPARTGAPPGSRATGQPYAPYRGVFNAEPSPAARMRIRTPTARRFARRRKAAERRPLPRVRGRKLLASRLIAEAASRSRGGKAIMPGPTALPLGIGHLSSRRPDVHEEDLHAGDRILAYPDGITDSRSPDGQRFGVDRLVDFVNRALNDQLPTPETMRRLVRAVMAHQGDELQDDATAMFLEWRPPRSPLAHLSALAAAGP